MHSRGGLSSRQRRSLAPWRMRPAETWSKSISTTSSGRRATHSSSLPALQRLGSAEPRSPDSYGARKPTSRRFSAALSPEQCPTTRSSGAVVEAEDERADGVRLLAGAPADEHRVDRAHALDLGHALALARAVWRGALLGDRALGVLEPFPGLAGAGDGGHQLDGRAVEALAGRQPIVREQPLERRTTLCERQLEQRVVSVREQVEGDVGRRASRRRGARCARRPGGCAGRARRSPRGRRSRARRSRRRARSGRRGTPARGSSARAACRCATAGTPRGRRRTRGSESRRA